MSKVYAAKPSVLVIAPPDGLGMKLTLPPEGSLGYEVVTLFDEWQGGSVARENYDIVAGHSGPYYGKFVETLVRMRGGQNYGVVIVAQDCYDFISSLRRGGYKGPILSVGYTRPDAESYHLYYSTTLQRRLRAKLKKILSLN